MTTLIPNLAPDELERLAILAEECGEVVQIIGKILRHGRYSTHPNGGDTNSILLHKELGDIQAVMRLMRAAGELDMVKVYDNIGPKLEKLEKYTHHQSKDLFTSAKLNL